MIIYWNAQISQKYKSDLKLLGARRMTRNNCQTQDPKTLGTAVRNIFATVTWRPEFLHHPIFYVDSTLLQLGNFL